MVHDRHHFRLSLVPRLAAAVAFVLFAVSAVAETAPQADTNRLIYSASPYLLQHAHNPVDWYPWGEEAIAMAKKENKPIFLSVGYSTCYWCHVAERTIYSNPAIAALMNRWFVNIKVDREERPDLDQTFMLARQLLTGSGGWPNNLFLTPDLKPFFAGSYFPPEDREGAHGFPTILKLIHEDWEKNRAEVERVVRVAVPASPGPGTDEERRQLDKDRKMVQRRALDLLDREEKLRAREMEVASDAEYLVRIEKEKEALRAELEAAKKANPPGFDPEAARREIDQRVKILQQKALDLLDREERLRKEREDLERRAAEE